MSETKPQSGDAQESAPPRKRRGKLLFMLLGLVVVLGGGAGAAWQFMPGVADKARSMMGHPSEQPVALASHPFFVELPEMAVTLPNNGHPRQMRIKLSVELTRDAEDKGSPEVLSPRVYDALLTYLRTLRDGEVDGGLGLDRLRADLYRRVDLIVGPGVLRDVLITSLILA
jgi:flagellar protein FliL